ncbi:hypothetical protein LX99_04662 [Mucilaginibacter oryzae]|uniref:Uncharacterized protein n=1 Tax=Mucilaginibacter oryzae TaxID=468058 RepID=A0A316GXD7_9SPHI|nr:hypothetical protein [Mucilaginibacter oryzae]PWK70009.1 hypothetical protein LX99_04662 [Mucilaginibacter oryzae]
MLIGSLFLGRVHEVNGQWIETKFVVFGIPLFPTSSMLVTKSAWRSRNGFNISLNKQSIIAGYARMFSVLTAAVFFILFFAQRDTGALVPGFSFLALWAYFYFIFGSPGTAEAEDRKRMGDLTGLYILPEWLSPEDAYRIYKRLEKKYLTEFDNADWLYDLQQNEIAPAKLPLLYTLSRFNYSLAATEANLKLFEKANRLYL